jgi:myosin-crossreactive antigen
MSKTGVISASLRTELYRAQAANSLPKPNDAFVELHDFVFGDGETLASLKLHYRTGRVATRVPPITDTRAITLTESATLFVTSGILRVSV